MPFRSKINLAEQYLAKVEWEPHPQNPAMMRIICANPTDAEVIVKQCGVLKVRVQKPEARVIDVLKTDLDECVPHWRENRDALREMHTDRIAAMDAIATSSIIASQHCKPAFNDSLTVEIRCTSDAMLVRVADFLIDEKATFKGKKDHPLTLLVAKAELDRVDPFWNQGQATGMRVG